MQTIIKIILLILILITFTMAAHVHAHIWDEYILHKPMPRSFEYTLPFIGILILSLYLSLKLK